MTAGPQTLSSLLEPQQRCSVSRGAQFLPLLGGFAKAHTKLRPTTPTSSLPEKGLLSASRLLWICSFPQINLFYSSPLKKQVTHGKGIAPQARTCFSQRIPLPTCILSVPCPGKLRLLILGDRRSSRHCSQPLYPASQQHTPPALSLTAGLLHSQFSLPTSQTFPKQLPSQGLSSEIPLHPSQPSYPFLSGEWFLCKPLFSLSCLASVATPVLPLLTLHFQLATENGAGKASRKG